MAIAALVADTLSAWREAERVLDQLAPGTPDHETARLLVIELHALYEELIEQRVESNDRVASSRVTIMQARQLLGALSAR